eukprot:1158744-Pelagomonas_calceolata.AAC.9
MSHWNSRADPCTCADEVRAQFDKVRGSTDCSNERHKVLRAGNLKFSNISKKFDFSNSPKSSNYPTLTRMVVLAFVASKVLQNSTVVLVGGKGCRQMLNGGELGADKCPRSKFVHPLQRGDKEDAISCFGSCVPSNAGVKGITDLTCREQWKYLKNSIKLHNTSQACSCTSSSQNPVTRVTAWARTSSAEVQG